jgi:hypothetical protein
MARRTIANFKSTVDSLFPDNTAKQITPDRVRSILYDAADSFLFSLQRKNINVTGGTITLDWELLADTFMVGDNGSGVLTAINGNKTMASFTNVTNAVTGRFLFMVTGTRNLTFQSNVFFPAGLGGWEDAGSKILTLTPGRYLIIFESDDSTNFYGRLIAY